MKRFEFPLERVRRWRLEQQNIEELKLQQLRAELEKLAAARRNMEHELEESGRRVIEQPSLDPLDLQGLDSFRWFVRGRIKQLDVRARECEEKIAGQRERVIDARRRFEVLDRLRKTAFGEWRAATDKEYETLAAEIFLAKARRNC